LAVVSIQAGWVERARGQLHHQRWFDGRRRPAEVIDGWRSTAFEMSGLFGSRVRRDADEAGAVWPLFEWRPVLDFSLTDVW